VYGTSGTDRKLKGNEMQDMDSESWHQLTVWKTAENVSSFYRGP